MKHKTIKKSIIFIMITTLLLSCVNSLAASTSTDENFTVQFADYNLSVDDIIDTHPDPNDPNNYYLAKYRVCVTPYIYFKKTGFVNGRFYLPCTTSVVNPNGGTSFVDIKIEPKSLLNDTVYSTQLWSSNPNSGNFYIYSYFSNYYVSSANTWVPIEPFYFEFTLQMTSNQSNNINFRIYSNDFSDTCNFSDTPQNSDLAAIITDSVINALGDINTANSVIELLYSLLIDLGASNILVANNGATLNDLLTALTNTYNHLVNSLTPQVLNKLDTIITKLQSLYDNIDDLIDTISWKKDYSLGYIGYSTSLFGTYYNSDSSNQKDLYIKLSPSNELGNINNILCFDIGLWCTDNYVLNKSNVSIRFYQDLNNFYDIEYYMIKMNYSYKFYILCPYKSMTSQNTYNIIININMNNNNSYVQYNTMYNKYTGYLPDTDIEYWDIVNVIYQYQLLHSGEEDTEAANQLSQAAQQMENAAAAMNVTKPNMNAVIPQTLADADTVAAQGTIFSWLNNNYIIAILSAMMTIALLGFVIYGKSG